MLGGMYPEKKKKNKARTRVKVDPVVYNWMIRCYLPLFTTIKVENPPLNHGVLTCLFLNSLNMVTVSFINRNLEEVSKLSFPPDKGNVSMSEY